MPSLPPDFVALRQSPNNINPSQAGVTGTNVSSPGTTNGSSVTALQNTNNATAGQNAIQSTISQGLSDAGFTASQVRSITQGLVPSAVTNNTTLPAAVPGESSAPAPTTSESSPAEVSDAKKDAMGEGGGGGLAFPSEITTAASMAHLKIEFWEVNREDAQSPGSKSPVQTIYLPLPENFQTDFNVSFDTVDTGATGVVANQLKSVANSFKENGMSVEAANKALAGIGKGAVDMATRAGYAALDSAESSLGGLVGGAAGASGFIQKALGAVPNPHPSVFFKGLPLRQFQFAWKLVPLDAGDAANLKEMLKVIKKNILPSKSGGTLTYPKLAKPEVVGKGAGRYDKYQPCFVESMSINYSGEGTSAFFKDGAPVSVFLTMQFRESELFTSGDVS